MSMSRNRGGFLDSSGRTCSYDDCDDDGGHHEIVTSMVIWNDFVEASFRVLDIV